MAWRSRSRDMPMRNRPQRGANRMTSREERFTPLSRAAVVSLLSMTVAGCTVGPNYHAPSMPPPPAYKEAAPATAAAPTPSLESWWKVFGDSTLDDLEGKALTANTDIKI